MAHKVRFILPTHKIYTSLECNGSGVSDEIDERSKEKICPTVKKEEKVTMLMFCELFPYTSIPILAHASGDNNNGPHN